MDLQPDQSEKIAQMVQGLKKKAISEQKEARKQIKHFIEGQQKQTTRSHFVLLMNEVYKIISTLINSNDHSDKMISVLLIDVLIEIKYEDPSSKVSRFSNHLKNLLLKHNITLSVIEKTTQVISNLAKFGGTMSSEFADSQIRLAIEFLHENRLESRRYAAVLLFTKLSITAPTIVNIHLSEYFDVIWVALSDPKIEIRKLAAKSLGNCFQLISTRDSQTRSQIYSTLYSEVQKNFNQSYADSIHGSVLVIAQLLKHSGDFMESYFEDICARIFRSKLPKTKSIRLAIVSLIPLLAKFSRNFFIEKYLETAVNHLFFLLNRDTLSRKTIFHSLGELTLVVENQIQPYSEEIIKKIVRSLNPKKKQYCEKSMICLSKLSHVCDIAEYIRRYKILDILFEISLSQTLTNTLSELAQFVPSFSFEIRHRLLNMISLIITKQQYNDMSLFHDQQMIIQPQITNLPTTTGFLNEQNMSEQTFLAFETIRTFDFQGHDLFKFLRYSILPFFNHENALLRKEAGLVCIQVINKNINENSELLYEIIDEIVSLCVRDPDPLIRTRLIKKLSKYRTQEINNHLLQTEILQKLFFLLYDEVNKNRKCSIRLLGELGTSNPGVILPVLRKLLISLLTEFEFSQDYVNKEQSVILIVNLIQSTHQLVVPYCESILNVFVPKLHQELQLNVSEPTVTEHLLLVIGALFEAGGSRLKKYVDDLFPFLLDSLQNQNLSIREAALHTLGQLIQSTGYVVEPYEKFPRLLSLLFKTIKSERDMGIKREALKVMGIVGALDPYQQKDKTTIQSGEFALESMRGEMKMGYGETMRENMIISPEKAEKIKGKKEKETLKKSQDLGNAGGEEKEKQANKTSGGQNKTGLKLVTVGGYGGYGETNEGYIGFWHSNVFKPSEKDEGDIQDTFEVTKYFAELSKAGNR
ncbi:serine/threonine-protein kinase tor [Anaeramoeba ignava]|uniref:Serine/threonine-protein kinase tor n=1 Tax=Anaeramoeba ignava TaxID=1746090 RepID=A0A9Q0LFQ7_ANAIG|nr:serine/threonine-protein kinase tor [Anaeramoeba ignava]